MDFLGHSLQSWIIFHLIIIACLALDLGVLNRKAHVIRMKEALGWSILWICFSLGFGVWLFYSQGHDVAIQYLTGYVVEESLSIDNLFVFLVIFKSMKINRENQHRLLFWGIFGAIVLRGSMIIAGAQLLERFHWLIYIFGAFLIFTGLKLFKSGHDDMDPKKSPVFKLAQRFLPLTTEHDHKGKFTLQTPTGRKFTMAFVALLLIESSDVIFALDSVPAVFGVTRDPYIVYTSNIFAILGLRSLFFVLEDLLYRFHLLKIGLAIVLIFVGVKMCIENWVHIAPLWSLCVIASVLGASIVMSLILPPKAKTQLETIDSEDA